MLLQARLSKTSSGEPFEYPAACLYVPAGAALLGCLGIQMLPTFGQPLHLVADAPIQVDINSKTCVQDRLAGLGSLLQESRSASTAEFIICTYH